MGKPSTKVLVLTDGKAEGGFRISYSALGEVAKDSLRMANLDKDSGDVMFVFRSYPKEMYAKEPEDPDNNQTQVIKYMHDGINTMAMIEKSSFMYGKDKELEKLSENELCHAIIDKLKCDNKTAFEISSSMRERVFHPYTHIIWSHSARKAPPFMMMFMDMHGSGITKEQYADMVERDASLMFIQACPKSLGIPAEGFTGKRTYTNTFVNHSGDCPIGRS